MGGFQNYLDELLNEDEQNKTSIKISKTLKENGIKSKVRVDHRFNGEKFYSIEVPPDSDISSIKKIVNNIDMEGDYFIFPYLLSKNERKQSELKEKEAEKRILGEPKEVDMGDGDGISFYNNGEFYEEAKKLGVKEIGFVSVEHNGDSFIRMAKALGWNVAADDPQGWLIYKGDVKSNIVLKLYNKKMDEMPE
jgi:hypothetical protein